MELDVGGGCAWGCSYVSWCFGYRHGFGWADGRVGILFGVELVVAGGGV